MISQSAKTFTLKILGLIYRILYEPIFVNYSMTRIDCAQNTELAQELTEFLEEKNCSVTIQNELLVVDENFSKSLLDSFLEKTSRTRHKITLVELDSYLIAIPVKMEDIGLESCEFCGYTSQSELVQVHRRTHQAL